MKIKFTKLLFRYNFYQQHQYVLNFSTKFLIIYTPECAIKIVMPRSFFRWTIWNQNENILNDKNSKYSCILFYKTLRIKLQV